MKAESEIAELKSKTAFAKQQLWWQIEDAEGSICASSICPSLMSLTLEEDFDKCFSQSKESSREVENERESSKLSQKYKGFDHKNHSPRAQSRGTNKSVQRKKLEKLFRKQTPCSSKAMRKYIFVQTSLPKLKLSEFHGGPLEWSDWSSLFTATIHNAPTHDNAEMNIWKHSLKARPRRILRVSNTQRHSQCSVESFGY